MTDTNDKKEFIGFEGLKKIEQRILTDYKNFIPIKEITDNYKIGRSRIYRILKKTDTPKRKARISMKDLIDKYQITSVSEKIDNIIHKKNDCCSHIGIIEDLQKQISELKTLIKK